MIIGQKVTLYKFVFALIGWESIGNSNWFIFTITVMYLLIFISFTIFKKNKLPVICIVTLMSVVFVVVMMRLKDDWYYNTVLSMPAGMWYSYFKDKIEKFVIKNNFTYLLVCAVIGVGFLFSYKNRVDSVAFYELHAVFFGLLIVLFTMKVHLGNKVLEWFGNHVFSVYVLQRIPMIALGQVEVISSNEYLYFALSLILTVIISELFDRAMKVIDGKLFKVKKA